MSCTFQVPRQSHLPRGHRDSAGLGCRRGSSGGLFIDGTRKPDPCIRNAQVSLLGKWVGEGEEGRKASLGHGAEGDGSEDDGIDHFEGKKE